MQFIKKISAILLFGDSKYEFQNINFLDEVIAETEQIIAQSVITGNTEFNDDSSDGGASSGDDSTTIDLGDYDLDDTDSVAKLQFVGNLLLQKY